MARNRTTAPKPLPDEVAADPLWQAIAAYDFDPNGAEITFAARLARENGWPPAYAEAAIAEYRRFLYLAQKADHMVVPSDEVDQAWHLHLLYSARYRDDFCARVLGKSFDHAPATGGMADADHHRRMYAKTLASYEAVFGARPPPAVWPDTAKRFRYGRAYRRVNMADYVVIPRLDKPKRIGIVICIIGLIIAIWTL
jgi:hypothetical protein